MFPTDAECVDILITQLTGAVEKAATDAGADLPLAFHEKAKAALDGLTALKAEMAEPVVPEPPIVAPRPAAVAPSVPARIEDPLATIAQYRDAAALTPVHSRQIADRLLDRLHLRDVAGPDVDPPRDVEGLMEWALGSGSVSTVAPLIIDWQTGLRIIVRQLPMRRAFWWSCLSAVYVLQRAGVATDAADWKSFEAAADWAMQPESSGAVRPLQLAPTGLPGELVARALTAAQGGVVGDAVADDLLRAVRLWLEKYVPAESRTAVAADICQYARDIAAGERLWPGGENVLIDDSWLSGLS